MRRKLLKKNILNLMLLVTVIFFIPLIALFSQDAIPIEYAPKVLPGKGLLQHSFLYTGEFDNRDNRDQTIFVVRNGKIVWSYAIPLYDKNKVLQELGDATMMSNGNIAFCKKTGASIITPDKKIIFNIDAEPNSEIHAIQPLGNDKALVVQNGHPSKIMTINTKTNKIEKTINLPTSDNPNPHLQFRRVRLTSEGTYLAAHLDNNKVAEYDANGKEIWSYNVPGPWWAARLKNGNTLITSYPNTVLEVNKKGEVVWKFSQEDAPDYKFFIFQEAGRLANGNTVICNWCPGNVKDPIDWPKTVQVLEVTPDKKIVWAMREWTPPMDFGTATSIQLLDEPGVSENNELQR